MHADEAIDLATAYAAKAADHAESNMDRAPQRAQAYAAVSQAYAAIAQTLYQGIVAGPAMRR